MRIPHHPQAIRGSALAAVCALAALTAASPATAGTGGIGGTSGGGDCKAGSEGKVSNGLAIPPCNAPRRVKNVIEAANEIAKGKGYCMGGGHQSWKSSCYDCSGAVSYALHGGKFIDAPEPSGSLESWGRRGKGDWITVYANGGHAFMTIAGLRFDTADTPGAGPGWASTMGYENPGEFVKRHPRRF